MWHSSKYPHSKSGCLIPHPSVPWKISTNYMCGGGGKKSKLSKGSIKLNWNFDREERVGDGSKNKNLHGRGILHFETTGIEKTVLVCTFIITFSLLQQQLNADRYIMLLFNTL